MRLTVLGCNGTYPTPGHPASGYLIETAEATIWIDCGSGTFAALQEYVNPTTVDAIVISHEHADHCVDVLPFAYSRRYGTPPASAVPVYAPRSVPERLEAFIGREGSAVFEALRFVEADPEHAAKVRDVTLTFVTVNHPVPTVAVRAVDGDRSVVFTADTGVSDQLAEFASGADLLLAEASYLGAPLDKPWPHHLTASEAGDLAARASVGRLLLTHLWPTNNPATAQKEAESRYSGPVAVASPGLVVEI